MKSHISNSLKYKRFTPLGCKEFNYLAYFILLRKIKTRRDTTSQSGTSNVTEI